MDLTKDKLLMVNSRRRNGLIIFKRYHAEFAGPGAAVGSFFDLNCHVLAVGNLSLIVPQSDKERQNAYLIRRQWARLTQKSTECPVPEDRVRTILQQFDAFFETETVAKIPDEAFALLVGVLPQTVHKVRHKPR